MDCSNKQTLPSCEQYTPPFGIFSVTQFLGSTLGPGRRKLCRASIQRLVAVETLARCTTEATFLNSGGQKQTRLSREWASKEKMLKKEEGKCNYSTQKYVNTSFRAQAFEGAFSYSSNIFSKKEKNLIDLSNRLPCIGLAETRTARAKSWSKKGRRPGPREEGGADGGRREFLLGAPRNA